MMESSLYGVFIGLTPSLLRGYLYGRILSQRKHLQLLYRTVSIRLQGRSLGLNESGRIL